jgi:hypothetical protein
LGGDIVFPREETTSFRAILEDPNVVKATFDCRTDSDALLHQIGVKLSGVLELQVFDQAVRIHCGEAPPERCPYVTEGGIQFLQGMSHILKERYSSVSQQKLPAPHRCVGQHAWSQRPLSSEAIMYAATDVYIIKELLREMRSVGVSHILMQAVKTHSQRYEGVFRDRETEVNRLSEKDFVMEEHAIISSAHLPASHPRKQEASRQHTVVRWNEVVAQLRSKQHSHTLYSQVLYILQHDHWYTKEGTGVLRKLAANYPHFTQKQRFRINDPPVLEDRYDDEDNDYGDDSYDDCGGGDCGY